MWSFDSSLRQIVEHAIKVGYTSDEIGGITKSVLNQHDIDVPADDASGCFFIIAAGLVGVGVGTVTGQGWGFIAAGGTMMLGYALWVLLKRKAK